MNQKAFTLSFQELITTGNAVLCVDASDHAVSGAHPFTQRDLFWCAFKSSHPLPPFPLPAATPQDYGNAETDNTSDGAGTMEAIYFGNAHWQNNSGAGNGPWLGADLECGMYYGGGNQTKYNKANLPLPFDFVSLYLRGGTDGFALKGGDATNGKLITMYDGPRPDCAIAGTCQRHGNHTYQPMSKKGAIILGTGGDNSNGAMGKFYEAYIVTGVTTDETDDAVQANIISVGYKNL